MASQRRLPTEVLVGALLVVLSVVVAVLLSRGGSSSSTTASTGGTDSATAATEPSVASTPTISPEEVYREGEFTGHSLRNFPDPTLSCQQSAIRFRNDATLYSLYLQGCQAGVSTGGQQPGSGLSTYSGSDPNGPFGNGSN